MLYIKGAIAVLAVMMITGCETEPPTTPHVANNPYYNESSDISFGSGQMYNQQQARRYDADLKYHMDWADWYARNNQPENAKIEARNAKDAAKAAQYWRDKD